jgi:hypothetical protein
MAKGIEEEEGEEEEAVDESGDMAFKRDRKPGDRMTEL